MILSNVLIINLILFALSFQVNSLDFLSLKLNGQEYLKNSNKTSLYSFHSYSEKVINSGYEFEEHKVLTKDGYILSAWRIPRKIGEKYSQTRLPVILQHGLLDDSWTWFALDAQDCLPIMLAKEGYDVWLTNSRGNIFSKEHIDPEYDSSSFRSKYWNFTFHEMAMFDLPAFTEYIKNHTLHDKLRYVGHSQGTFQFFLSYLLNPQFIENNFEKYATLGTVVTIFNIVIFKFI
jgi:lysosomal acid lipase/cholesteryl ester hydrolase